MKYNCIDQNEKSAEFAGQWLSLMNACGTSAGGKFCQLLFLPFFLGAVVIDAMIAMMAGVFISALIAVILVIVFKKQIDNHKKAALINKLKKQIPKETWNNFSKELKLLLEEVKNVSETWVKESRDEFHKIPNFSEVSIGTNKVETKKIINDSTELDIKKSKKEMFRAITIEIFESICSDKELEAIGISKKFKGFDWSIYTGIKEKYRYSNMHLQQSSKDYKEREKLLDNCETWKNFKSGLDKCCESLNKIVKTTKGSKYVKGITVPNDFKWVENDSVIIIHNKISFVFNSSAIKQMMMPISKVIKENLTNEKILKEEK